MTEKIRIEQLSIKFPIRNGYMAAVDDASISFLAGEITGIIGESGCGKSVLGMGMLGLLPAYAQVSGEIWFGDRELLSLKPGEMRKVRGRELGLIAQNPADSLNPVRKIKKQLLEAIRLDKKNQAEHQLMPARLLKSFGFRSDQIKTVLNSYPFQLSGGMQQRTVTAMGIASGADWILADEPSKGLDLALREQLYESLREVKRHHASGMIIITHDIVLAEALCDSVAVMYGGQIVEKGRQVLKSPRHPYTQGLLAAMPSQGMQIMAGQAPAPGERIKGCKFMPRCKFAMSVCGRECPQNSGDDTEMVRCFLYA